MTTFSDSEKYLFAASSIENNAPANSGVYVIWNGYDVCLYVGEAGDIRDRLTRHLNTAETCLMRNVPIYFWSENCDQQTRMIRERELCAELKPLCTERVG